MDILGKLPTMYWNNEIQCEEFAISLRNPIKNLLPQTLKLNIWLEGNLGVGKTTFVRYFLRSLGFLGKVKSPTYTLCEPYQMNIDNQILELHHFDLYRMQTPMEWEDAGFRDILTNPGISMIEWPEKAQGTLPKPDLIINIQYKSEEKREITLSASSNLGLEILNHYASS